jgi:hypothetical protein
MSRSSRSIYGCRPVMRRIGKDIAQDMTLAAARSTSSETSGTATFMHRATAKNIESIAAKSATRNIVKSAEKKNGGRTVEKNDARDIAMIVAKIVAMSITTMIAIVMKRTIEIIGTAITTNPRLACSRHRRVPSIPYGRAVGCSGMLERHIYKSGSNARGRTWSGFDRVVSELKWMDKEFPLAMKINPTPIRDN